MGQIFAHFVEVPETTTSVVMTEVYDPFRILPQERMDTWDSYMKLNIRIETLLIETVKH